MKLNAGNDTVGITWSEVILKRFRTLYKKYLIYINNDIRSNIRMVCGKLNIFAASHLHVFIDVWICCPFHT